MRRPRCPRPRTRPRARSAARCQQTRLQQALHFLLPRHFAARRCRQEQTQPPGRRRQQLRSTFRTCRRRHRSTRHLRKASAAACPRRRGNQEHSAAGSPHGGPTRARSSWTCPCRLPRRERSRTRRQARALQRSWHGPRSAVEMCCAGPAPPAERHATSSQRSTSPSGGPAPASCSSTCRRRHRCRRRRRGRGRRHAFMPTRPRRPGCQSCRRWRSPRPDCRSCHRWKRVPAGRAWRDSRPSRRSSPSRSSSPSRGGLKAIDSSRRARALSSVGRVAAALRPAAANSRAAAWSLLTSGRVAPTMKRQALRRCQRQFGSPSRVRRRPEASPGRHRSGDHRPQRQPTTGLQRPLPRRRRRPSLGRSRRSCALRRRHKRRATGTPQRPPAAVRSGLEATRRPAPSAVGRACARAS
mmetsp:Transcript_31777/g.99178  ORF Transcript_31777/g.99178 Transcript_31777/m.99178 type:complete len:412 (-) Transcript_31777:298-1533(-)